MSSNEYLSKPIEKGNSENIKEVCLKLIPLTMLYYEAIANFYSEEPEYIRIKLKEDSEFYLFEQVFRFRLWIPNKKISAWCVYSEDREWLLDDDAIGGLVIRNSEWDREFDLCRIKNIGKSKEMDDWPNIKLNTVYLEPKLCSELLSMLKQFDNMVENGIQLESRKEIVDDLDWKDIEIMRRFNWGQIHSTWSSKMTNIQIEEFLNNFTTKLDFCMKNTFNKIYRMDLDYSCPAELKKVLISGNK